jgi:prophage antirepressor-like protein
MGIYKILKDNDIKYIKDRNIVEAQSFLHNSGITCNPRNYVKDSKIIQNNKIKECNRIYMPISVLFKILQKAKKNEAKEFYNKVNKYENKFETNKKKNKNSEYKTLKNINGLDGNNKFIYNGYKINYIKIDNDKIYFKGVDVANVLEYKNSKDAIIKNVYEDDKIKMKELREVANCYLPNEDKKTIYITESGLYTLILKSRMKNALEFQKWITKKILPSLRKNGSYVINPEITDYSKYEIKDLSRYYDYKVFYIFYICFINNKHVFKYGITSNIYKRYRQHKNDFEEYDNKIYPIYVINLILSNA